MNKTKEYPFTEETLTVPFTKFIELIGGGRKAAMDIAIAAEARIYRGRRLLINIDKVKKYLDDASE